MTWSDKQPGIQGTPLSRMAGPAGQGRRASFVIGRSQSSLQQRPGSAPAGPAIPGAGDGAGGESRVPASSAGVPLPALVDALVALAGVTEVPMPPSFSSP